MSKKLAFQKIIADFIEKPILSSIPREIDVPLDVPKIISLIGPRRAGKTHILYSIINELRKTTRPSLLIYLNFEDDRIFPLRLEDMDDMLEAYYELYPNNREEKVWFFFDEVQEVPNWEKFVRRLSDTENCRIYLTGSSSKLLSRELATTLRGRTLVYEVFPLSLSEFLAFNQVEAHPETSKGQSTILHWFDRWLVQGGFPELVFLPETLHKRTIEEYLDLTLYRDLTERFSIRHPALLKYLLKYTLSNIAQANSITKIYNDVKSQGYELAKNTVFEYMSYLEEAFILFKVNIWHRSVRVQTVNPTKFYGIDPAFKYALNMGEDTGRVLENAVFLHLRRQGFSPHYWIDKQELDFYWENGQAINVCLNMAQPGTREREIKGMVAALEFLDLPEGYILTRDQTEDVQVGNKKVLVRPAWRYMLVK